MLNSIVDALLEVFEFSGESFPTFKRRVRHPAVGTLFRARQPARLSGRDLRPLQVAAGFTLEIPARTIVRITRVNGVDGDGIWVQPTDPTFLALLPRACETYARAYGYALDVPPGILETQFEVV